MQGEHPHITSYPRAQNARGTGASHVFEFQVNPIHTRSPTFTKAHMWPSVWDSRSTVVCDVGPRHDWYSRHTLGTRRRWGKCQSCSRRASPSCVLTRIFSDGVRQNSSRPDISQFCNCIWKSIFTKWILKNMLFLLIIMKIRYTYNFLSIITNCR